MNTLKRTSYHSPTVDYSRSKEINKAHLSKLQDMTLYNSSKFNVYLYKNSPNRGSTPIKAPLKNSGSQGFFNTRKTQHDQMLLNMARSFENLPIATKTKFITEGTKLQLRAHTRLPLMSEHKIRKIAFVPNDSHVRETNPGFARNDFGGFFTH